MPQNPSQSDAARDTTAKTILRPEAKPYTWSALDDSQQRAFGTVMSALSEAVSNLDSDSHHSRDMPAHMQLNRGNHSVLLTGDRGTGKTSLFLTMRRATIVQSQWGVEITQLEKEDKNASDNYRRLAQNATTKVSQRILWLDPLEMEILPGPCNLLVAILARIDAIVSRVSLPQNSPQDSQQPRGILDASPGYEDALMKLGRLTTDASLAWDGNVIQRAAQLDPDTYATEVKRAKRSRLDINRRLGDALTALADELSWGGRVTNPLFVLPVDDFDLNPVRCLELLRLLRSIAVPRLFTLILGDIDQAEEVLQLKMTGDFAGIMDAETVR